MSIFEDANIQSGEWDLVGYLNDIKNPREKLGKYPVLGGTDKIKYFVDKGYYIHNTLYFNSKEKKTRVDKFKDLNLPLESNASAIHPTAIIAPGARIGHGVLINQFSLLQVNCDVKNFIHIYSNSLIGHESKIYNYSTIGAHSIVGARVILKEGVHVGLNVSIREDLIIESYSVLGMGSVVIKNVNKFEIHGGNPAKPIK